MILAGGVVLGEQWLTNISQQRRVLAHRITYGFLAVGAVIGVGLMLPIGPIDAALGKVRNEVHDNFVNQIGWEELAATVADVYQAHKPISDASTLGVLAMNHGQVSALNLYGTRYGLPTAISPVNSFWLRGYGTPPPTSVIAIGFSRDVLTQYFATCDVVGQLEQRNGFAIAESADYPDIFLCHELRLPWDKVWSNAQRFS